MTRKNVNYRGLYPSIKYFKSFLNNFIFLSNLFENKKVLVQNSTKNGFEDKSKELFVKTDFAKQHEKKNQIKCLWLM